MLQETGWHAGFQTEQTEPSLPAVTYSSTTQYKDMGNMSIVAMSSVPLQLTLIHTTITFISINKYKIKNARKDSLDMLY